MKTQLIAEVGINANGDIELAKDMIAMAKGCGWDYVKFQKRHINTVYSQDFLDGPRASPWGTTQRAQKEALEFSPEDYKAINYYCKINRIPWFASAWDIKSLECLETFSPPFHKVASAFITNLQFLETVAKLRRKTIISTGMCHIEDIIRAVEIFEKAQCEHIIMHCVSTYPCPPEDCNIEYVRVLKGMFPHKKIGYSGHEVGIMPTLAAVAFGAEYIERHITLDRTMYGSDQAASLERSGMVKVREYADEIVRCLGDGMKRIIPAEEKTAKSLRYWE